MSASPESAFGELGLAEPVLKGVIAAGYESPSPIQAQSIPPLLAGRDLLGQAQTGTGKTAAFALPLLSRLDVSVKRPQLLILTPTRELAIQVAEALQTYARFMRGFHVLPVYGGQSLGLQLRQLQRGAQVIVGTPGRILDHLGRGSLQLDAVRAVVLDEADEMLRMGFIDDVESILEQSPPQRQVALFSATMPPAIARVANRHLKNPAEIRIAARTATVDAIVQRYWAVDGVHKLDALTRILEVEEFGAILVFVRTKLATQELADRLEARGYEAAALNGDMPQAQREKTVERLRAGTLDIVVATDVAARGLDVERITHVINYDIPSDPESYVHRIGRTGRAGRKGQAILFVARREMRLLRTIEHATRKSIAPMRLPTQEEISGRRIERFKQTLDETLQKQELGFFRRLVENYCEERAIDSNELGAALAFLVQQKNPLSPPPIGRSGEPDRARSRRPKMADGKAGIGGPAPQGSIRYRIEVGRDHGVQPKNVVGAIANEAGLDSGDIGHIKLYDEYSTVDLPAGMPRAVFKHLQGVWVCGRQLRISGEDLAMQSNGGERKGGLTASAGAPGKRKKKVKTKNKDKDKDKGKRKTRRQDAASPG